MKGMKKLDENVIAPYRSLTITNPNLIDNSNWQIGTLKCNPERAGLTYKSDSAGNFSLFDATYILAPNTVTSLIIQDGTIQTIDLSDKCVTNNKIADRTINHMKLQLQTLTDDEMAAQSITTRALKDKNITDEKIADVTITNRPLADRCVQYRNLDVNSVGTMHLLDNTVTENKLANESVSANKLKNSSVTYKKIVPYTIIGGEMTEIIENGQRTMVQGNIAQGTITGYNIANNSIIGTNIMTGTITNRCIGDGEIYGEKIKPKSILYTHIADNTITGGQIANDTISTNNYKDKSITLAKLADEVFSKVANAVTYDSNGNVTMLMESASSCTVKIGSEDADGKSMANGSLRVYGDIRADRVYNMAYADLAEGYIPGEDLEPGDIVELREDGKVYKAYSNGLPAVIVGVVSDEYATCYGASKEELEEGSKVAVALIGKVHVKIKGPVRIGEPVKINNIPGVGLPWSNNNIVVGKALETVEEDGMHKVLCLIKPS